MTKLEEMWVEFEKHQSKADDNGHGKSWAEMCSLRTEEACKAAARAAYTAAVLAVDAVCGGFAAAADAAADALAYAANAEYWKQAAIHRINKATGETND